MGCIDGNRASNQNMGSLIIVYATGVGIDRGAGPGVEERLRWREGGKGLAGV